MPIRVKCGGCGRGVKAPDSMAGKQAKCPGCGAALLIPKPVQSASMTTPAPQNPPAPSLPATTPAPPPPAADPVASTAAHDPNEVILTARPSLFAAHPFGLVFWALAMLIGLGFYFTAKEPPIRYGGVGIVGLGLLRVGAWWLDCLGTRLMVTRSRTQLRLGLLSKRTREVRHADVRLLTVDQSFAQRLLGVGDIAVGSAGHGDVEVEAAGLKRPQAIKDQIDALRP